MARSTNSNAQTVPAWVDALFDMPALTESTDGSAMGYHSGHRGPRTDDETPDCTEVFERWTGAQRDANREWFTDNDPHGNVIPLDDMRRETPKMLTYDDSDAFWEQPADNAVCTCHPVEFPVGMYDRWDEIGYLHWYGLQSRGDLYAAKCEVCGHPTLVAVASDYQLGLYAPERTHRPNTKCRRTWDYTFYGFHAYYADNWEYRESTVGWVQRECFVGHVQESALNLSYDEREVLWFRETPMYPTGF